MFLMVNLSYDNLEFFYKSEKSIAIFFKNGSLVLDSTILGAALESIKQFGEGKRNQKLPRVQTFSPGNQGKVSVREAQRNLVEGV